MVTKGIIKKIPAHNLSSPDYKFDVRIPLFEEAGSNTEFILKSCLCYNQKEAYSYKVDDIVYVAFEDNNLDRPIILGKLWCVKNNNENKDDDNVSLPDNTYFKGTSLSKYIEEQIVNSGGGGGGGLNNKIDTIILNGETYQTTTGTVELPDYPGLDTYVSVEEPPYIIPPEDR